MVYPRRNPTIEIIMITEQILNKLYPKAKLIQVYLFFFNSTVCSKLN